MFLNFQLLYVFLYFDNFKVCFVIKFQNLYFNNNNFYGDILSLEDFES